MFQFDTSGNFTAIIIETGVINTGGKFATGINNSSSTKGKIYSSVIDTRVHIDLQISRPIFEKFWNDPDVIFRCLGEDDSWKKNLKQKNLWRCPFKC